MGMDFKDAFDPFRALRHGFAALQKEPVSVIVAGFALTILDSCQGGGGNNIPSDMGSGSGMDEAVVAIIAMVALIGCCIGIAVLLAKAFVEPGAWRIAERLTVDGTSGLDPLFSGKDVWLSMLGYTLLKGLIAFGVFIVSALPGGLVIGVAFALGQGDEPNVPVAVAGAALAAVIVLPAMIYVTLGLQLGNLAISLEQATAMEALDRSWTLARGNRVQLFLFNLINGLLMFGGLLLCCVGVIPARGVVLCATANAFLLHTRDDYESFALVQEQGAL